MRIRPLPGVAEAAKTLADGRRYIQGCEGISVTRRRNGLSALSGVERICGMPAGAIELTCPNLRRLLYRKPPAAFGFAPQRFGKLLIALRYVMRGMGLHAPKPSLNGLTAAWRDLFDALPSLRDAAPGYRQIALGAFIGFSSDAGIEPTDVSAEVLESVRNVSHQPHARVQTCDLRAPDGLELELGTLPRVSLGKPAGTAPAVPARALHITPRELAAFAPGGRTAVPGRPRRQEPG